MKIFGVVALGLVLLGTSLFAQSVYQEAQRMKNAYKSISVVDLASCKHRVKKEFEWRWFSATHGGSPTASYVRRHAHYKKLAYEKCKKDWQ